MGYKSYKLLKKIKRAEMIVLINEYYKSIGRDITPDYWTYTKQELINCIVDYEIEIKYLDNNIEVI
jgi:hypothetical protein